MVVHRDGLTRTYESRVTPGASISTRFAARYAAAGPLDGAVPHNDPKSGVSSAEKADHYHARNLKVSELTRQDAGSGTTTMAKVIGHGVLDMWDIPDPAKRAEANKRGAREVLEAALTTNDRLKATAMAGNRPVTMTHVSVNLVTPNSQRELPGIRSLKKTHDYQELTYTRAQFEAFRANSSAETGGAIPLGKPDRDDPNDPNSGFSDFGNVYVNPITFSFGINPMATGAVQGTVWKNVHAHNHAEMVKFIGDVGEVDRNQKNRASGTAIGGFIGGALDKVVAEGARSGATRAQQLQASQLAQRMREQTERVRQLFGSEAFSSGNGDPAKMGREILALQAMAEEAFSLLNVPDQAATMSKGCKSDKDRGGVTDVELKHKLITEDMGGQVYPDAQLHGDDQENYYIVSAASGQLENQRLNTGFAGSKEAGKLEMRIPNKLVRRLLKGLGALASE